MSNKQIQKFNVGAIHVSIWENKAISKEGVVKNYHSVSVDRNYKTKQGEWKNTNSLKVHDLPKAILALQKAYEYLALKDSNAEALETV